MENQDYLTTDPASNIGRRFVSTMALIIGAACWGFPGFASVGVALFAWGVYKGWRG